ncbi:phosphate ABC transporter substrate-binding/OmpA family protein [Pseudoponticoccus marisrubri]|uniref:Cell envelope biogenesis protein OmpA n=1 Tax=Pseudoponticoccus marisrubri TaxID=1685382 RepID=A0A0W7WJ70_9RHOB|nr:phosphate ABC transporter substrate-binding/OmpA family protein [Pseudoponticoccus marisrubri]KUF10675.1 cell envelope biogenesis protein OmpA [Pseudoponticoccus marisrubri]
MWTTRAAIFAALFVVLGPLAAWAQDVTLRSRDGAIELTGTLLGFDGQFYRIETQYGELTVDGSGVLCDGVGCPSLTDYVAEVTISGSATIGRVLLPALIEGFALRNGLTATRLALDDRRFTYALADAANDTVVGRFHMHLGTTDEGFADLLADEADVVMAVREIRAEENAAAEAEGLGDLTQANRSHVIALDAIVPVVAPGNPVDAISLPDLSAVLDGRITNWRQLGGVDAPITLHLKPEGSGLAQSLEDRFLSPLKATWTDQIERHPTDEDLSFGVTRDPFGLGLTSFAETGNTKPLVLTGRCGFALRAARRTIKTEDFPLTAPMFIYLPARRLPKLAREFLAFTASPPAQIVIRRAGFVDQAPEEVSIDLQGDRFANAITVAEGSAGLRELQRMVETLSGMRRLTTSFRFEAGATRLDAQSRSNVMQLARALETGAYDGRQVVFVGFSDGQGPASANLEIARQRAQTVRDAVEQAAETAELGRIEIATEAFGEAMPMACDDSRWGRQVNRRVEIWVR